jgi:hypothetical protein
MSTSTTNGTAPTARWRIASLPGPAHDVLTGPTLSPRVIQPEQLLVEAPDEYSARVAFCERFGIDPALADHAGGRDGRDGWRLERMPDATARQPFAGSRPDDAYAPDAEPEWRLGAVTHNGLTEVAAGQGAGLAVRLEIFANVSPRGFMNRGRDQADAELARLCDLAGRLPRADTRPRLWNVQAQLRAAREHLAQAESQQASAMARAAQAMDRTEVLLEHGRGSVSGNHLDQAGQFKREAAEWRDRVEALEALHAEAEQAVGREEELRARWLPQVEREADRLRAVWLPRLAGVKERLAKLIGEEIHTLLLASAIARNIPPAK